MKKSTKENHSFKLKIKSKGHEAISFEVWELINACWDYIIELERGNPNKILQDHEMLDSLMQNYYTYKMVHTEFGTETCDELKAIEQFIQKHNRRLLLSDLLRENKDIDPKMIFPENENSSADFQ